MSFQARKSTWLNFGKDTMHGHGQASVQVHVGFKQGIPTFAQQQLLL